MLFRPLVAHFALVPAASRAGFCSARRRCSLPGERRRLMVRLGFGTSLFVTLALALLSPRAASAQGQELQPIKVNLPPPPNFDVPTAPPVYPSGEMSVYGLRKGMSKYLDKDVRVKGYLLMIYECPAELRKCNDEAAAKAKREKHSGAPSKGGLPAAGAPEGGCRPCDQPHFFIG